MPLICSPAFHVLDEETTTFGQIIPSGNPWESLHAYWERIWYTQGKICIVLHLPLKTFDRLDLEGWFYVTVLLCGETEQTWCKSKEMKQLVSVCTQKG